MSAGNIYDLGYRPYDGERLGRRKAYEALYVNSARGIFGLGRSTMNKVFPMALASMAGLPATIQLAIAALAPTPIDLVEPQNYFGYVEIILGLLCAVACPELIGRDQRNRTLSLYFSRALSRTDYVTAKLMALVVALSIVILIPQTQLMLGNAVSTNRVLGYLWDNLDVWPPLLASTFGVAIMMASVSLAIACQTPRRGLATAVVIAYFVIFTTLGRTLLQTTTGDFRNYSLLISPLDVLEGFVYWVFSATPEGRPIAEVDVAGWVWFTAVLVYTGVGLTFVYRRVLRLQV